jgi:tetratricopeptide (TPR) repeat protein
MLVLAPVFGNAQDFKRQYNHAKDLFNAGSYNLAMEAFKTLIPYDKNNPYTEYASFYYSISAEKQGYPAVAKEMLLLVRRLYPEWDQQDEITYWLAKIYFDQHEFFQALKTLDEIRSASFEQDVKGMKRNYLKAITDVETLRMMSEEHSQDEDIGYALASTIAQQPFLEQDRQLLSEVIAKFSFSRDEFSSSLAPISIKKDRYRVSLLFPFQASALEPTPKKKRSQFTLDLYEGMKLALDTLSAQGINIDLLAYDTERNPEVLKRLLESDELKSSDLIVGPLSLEESKLVQDFSVNNKVNIINPVSNNSDFLGENPFALLFQPSYETIGIKSAEVAWKRIKNKNCIVYFGENPKDSVMAFNFMKRATELGIKIVLAEELSKETSARILSTLATATERDEFKNPIQFSLKKDSVGSIFVASDNPLIYTKVISSVETRNDSTIIIGSENWLSGDVNYEKLERLHILLAAPNFTPLDNVNYLDFRRKFIRRHGTFSSDYFSYAKIGFEFMMFVSRSLNRNGVYFQLGFTGQGNTEGYLYKAFNFQEARDNQYVPFIYFEAGQMTSLDEID